MEAESKPLVLLFGSTGETGFHIANKFLDEGYPVRVVVRSKDKLGKMFREREIAFEKVVVGGPGN